MHAHIYIYIYIVIHMHFFIYISIVIHILMSVDSHPKVNKAQTWHFLHRSRTQRLFFLYSFNFFLFFDWFIRLHVCKKHENSIHLTVTKRIFPLINHSQSLIQNPNQPKLSNKNTNTPQILINRWHFLNTSQN